MLKDHIYRCSTCNKNYPHRPEFKQCLHCDGNCWPKKTQDGDVLEDSDEIRAMIREREFAEFCEERDRKSMENAIDFLSDPNKPLYVSSIVGV